MSSSNAGAHWFERSGGGRTCWRGQCHQSAANLRRRTVNVKGEINRPVQITRQICSNKTERRQHVATNLLS